MPSIRLSTLCTSYPTINPRTPLNEFDTAPKIDPRNPWNALPVDCSVRSIPMPFLKLVMNAQGDIDKWDKTFKTIFFIG